MCYSIQHGLMLLQKQEFNVCQVENIFVYVLYHITITNYSLLLQVIKSKTGVRYSIDQNLVTLFGVRALVPLATPFPDIG